MSLKNFLFVVITLALTACVTPIVLHKASAVQELPAITPGKAQIVFMRPSNTIISGAFAGFLYDVKDGNDQLISPIMGGSKVIYEVDPGQHVFMSNGVVIAHFMDANVEAGKRYYVLVRYVHAYGLQLRPIRIDGTTEYNTALKDFPSWLKGTQRVESSEAVTGFLTQYKAGYEETRAKGFKEWQEKSPTQRAELTLNASDGVTL